MRSDTTILAFDTSAAHCAAALLSGDRIRAERTEHMTKGQAERLMPLLEELMQAAGIGLADLDAIGVGTGPGNFTGTRLSVAAARGLALASGVPAIGVSTLEAMAWGQDGPALCTLDARREMIYAQAFGTGVEAQAALVTLEEVTWPEALPAPAVIGHRAEEIARRLGGSARPPVRSLPHSIARIAQMRLRQPERARPAPLYIRPPDAAPPSDPPPVILP